MAGSRIPGPQCHPDPSIEDGTLARLKSPTPGHVDGAPASASKSGDSAHGQQQATLTICVFFFGGYQSSSGDMDLWLHSAEKQRSDVAFHGFPYPPRASAEPSDRDVDGFASVITTIDETRAEKIFIVGHSSGCAIANEVDRRLKDHTRIALVALDGFAPDAGQLKRASTQIWAAESGAAKSYNHDRLVKRVGDRLQIFHAHSDCTTELALHFSLVNVSANDGDLKSFKTDLGNGYKACVANLCWLK